MIVYVDIVRFWYRKVNLTSELHVENQKIISSEQESYLESTILKILIVIPLIVQLNYPSPFILNYYATNCT